MTGRTCAIHGEYAADGVCRWCEVPTMHPNVPAGSTPCRCGKYAWTPWCREERNAVFDGMAHSPEQCFKLDATPRSSPTMYETTFTVEKTEEAHVWRLEIPLRAWLRAPPSWRLDYEDPAYVAELNAAEESRFATQHAALRWERVARRWNYKHRRCNGPDEYERAYVWRAWLSQVDRFYRASLPDKVPP